MANLFDLILKDPKKVEILTIAFVSAGLIYLGLGIYYLLFYPTPTETPSALGLTILGIGITLIFGIINISASRIYSEQTNENIERLLNDLDAKIEELNKIMDKSKDARESKKP